MHDREFERQLKSLHSGELSFAQFARESRKTWLALAHYLAGRWRPPVAVDVEDLVQQLLLACWRFLPKWDAERGTRLDDYIVYNCTDKAKKWLHRQRNAYRRDGKSPSRVEVPISTLGLEPHAEEALLARVAVDGDQESGMLRREALRAVPSKDVVFLCYKQSLDVLSAGEKLFGNPSARLALGLSSVEAACAAVERSIELAAESAA